jgi:uncharacterized membrane protein
MPRWQYRVALLCVLSAACATSTSAQMMLDRDRTIASVAQGQVHPEKPTYKFEKCYGIAKAGKNDCFTAKNACGGTSEADRQGDAWIYLPAGVCERIVGGSLEPKK